MSEDDDCLTDMVWDMYFKEACTVKNAKSKRKFKRWELTDSTELEDYLRCVILNKSVVGSNLDDFLGSMFYLIDFNELTRRLNQRVFYTQAKKVKTA